MRTFEALNRTYRVNERDRKQLVKRFDVEKIEVDRRGLCRIDAPCICKYYYDCEGCPFGSCSSVLRDMGLNPKHAELWADYIWFSSANFEEAKQEIQAIRDWILSWEKV